MSDYTVAGYPPQTFEGEGWELRVYKADTYEFTQWDNERRMRVKTGEWGVRLVGEFSPGHSSKARGAVLEDVQFRQADGLYRVARRLELVSFRRNQDRRGPVGGPHTAVGREV